VLKRDTAYRDSLDAFALRVRVTPERRRQMEETALAPLTRHLSRFETIFQEHETACNEAGKPGAQDRLDKLRPALVKAFTESPLVAGTSFRKTILAQWGEWEKAKDPTALLAEIRKERRQLLDRKVALDGEGKTLPEADRQRLAEIEFKMQLGILERTLRTCEKLAGVAGKEKTIPEKSYLLENLRMLTRQTRDVFTHAENERTGRWRQSWPHLLPVPLDDQDLLGCAWEQAERTLAARLKTPEALLSGKKKVRQLRTLAKAYSLQQELLDLSHALLESNRNALFDPPQPAAGLAGPKIEDLYPFLQHDTLVQALLDAQADYAKVKDDLVRTWIDYQVARLDLYRDVDVLPPSGTEP
jgi:hypothetical protein